MLQTATDSKQVLTESNGDPPRILIAEDDKNSAIMLTKVLQREGFPDPAWVATGEEAIEYVRNHKIDIFISDIGLPGDIDGIEASNKISSEFNIPIIYITGFSDGPTIARAKQTMPAAYLLKPFKSEDVAIAIEMAMHKAHIERKLREAQYENRLHATALKSISDAVAICKGKSAKIESINEAFSRIVGYSLEECLDKPIQFICGKKSAYNHWEEAELRTHNGEEYHWESWQYGKDDIPFLGNWSVTSFFDPNDNEMHMIYVLRDITSLREFEERQSQSQRLESIGRFTGGIAHDFNNLLAVINSYSDLLKLKLGEEHPYLNYLENIRTAGRRGTDLVAQLMTFTRNERTQKQIISLTETLDELFPMIRRLIRSQIIIDTDIQTSPAYINANPSQIEQVIINLCLNARDAIPDNGTIKLTIEEVHSHRKDSKDSLPAGDYIRLSIQDNGHGMSEDVQKKIFEPFFTTKEVGKGTGLGLSTVYGIVRQSDSYIRVYSTLDVGSRFEIDFPVANTESIKEQAGHTKEELINKLQGEETILLISKDTKLNNSTKAVLSVYGYQAEAFESCEAALEESRDKLKEVDLIVLPDATQDTHHAAFLKAIKEMNPDACLLQTIESGSNWKSSLPEVLHKPYSSGSIIRKIREILDKS